MRSDPPISEDACVPHLSTLQSCINRHRSTRNKNDAEIHKSTYSRTILHHFRGNSPAYPESHVSTLRSGPLIGERHTSSRLGRKTCGYTRLRNVSRQVHARSSSDLDLTQLVRDQRRTSVKSFVVEVYVFRGEAHRSSQTRK